MLNKTKLKLYNHLIGFIQDLNGRIGDVDLKNHVRFSYSDRDEAICVTGVQGHPELHAITLNKLAKGLHAWDITKTQLVPEYGVLKIKSSDFNLYKIPNQCLDYNEEGFLELLISGKRRNCNENEEFAASKLNTYFSGNGVEVRLKDRNLVIELEDLALQRMISKDTLANPNKPETSESLGKFTAEKTRRPLSDESIDFLNFVKGTLSGMLKDKISNLQIKTEMVGGNTPYTVNAIIKVPYKLLAPNISDHDFAASFAKREAALRQKSDIVAVGNETKVGSCRL